MNVDSLIESDRFASLTGLMTLTSREITDRIQILICGRTVSRIDLDPMSAVQTTTGSDVSGDTITKTNDSIFDFGQIATGPITLAIFGNGTNVIQKRMRMSPTMTGIVLGYNIKRTTFDNRTIFVTAQINQIVAIIKKQCHFVSPLWALGPDNPYMVPADHNVKGKNASL